MGSWQVIAVSVNGEQAPCCRKGAVLIVVQKININVAHAVGNLVVEAVNYLAVRTAHAEIVLLHILVSAYNIKLLIREGNCCDFIHAYVEEAIVDIVFVVDFLGENLRKLIDIGDTL